MPTTYAIKQAATDLRELSFNAWEIAKQFGLNGEALLEARYHDVARQLSQEADAAEFAERFPTTEAR